MKDEVLNEELDKLLEVASGYSKGDLIANAMNCRNEIVNIISEKYPNQPCMLEKILVSIVSYACMIDGEFNLREKELVNVFLEPVIDHLGESATYEIIKSVDNMELIDLILSIDSKLTHNILVLVICFVQVDECISVLEKDAILKLLTYL